MTPRVNRFLMAAGASVMVIGSVVPLGAHAQTANTYTAYKVGINGGEPSIGFDPFRNAALYGSGTNVKRLAWDDTAAPATMSVTDIKPATAVTTLDAITAVDQVTGRSFNTQLVAACSLSSFSDDAGTTWTPDQGCGEDTLLDHESIGGGPFHAPVPALPSPAYPDAVYYCAQNGFNSSCAVSLDGGLTFGPGVYVANTPANDPNDPNPTFAAEGGACVGLHGHVKVGPDGTAYLPLGGCNGQPTINDGTNYEYWGGRPALSISTNNGAGWLLHIVPPGTMADGRGGSNPVSTNNVNDPSVAISKQSGVVYFAWNNGVDPSDVQNGTTSQVGVAVSHDDGTTWSAPIDVSSPNGLNNVMFPEIVAGDDNRASVAYLGTSAIGDDQTNAFPKNPPWHLYVSTTYDGGKTWSTVDTTPNDAVERGCIDMQGTTIPPSPRADICSQRNLLDFNDATIDREGRLLVAYSDGCEGACEADTASGSTGAVDMVMRQSGGALLYAAGSPAVPEAPLALLFPLGGAAILIAARRRALGRRRTIAA